MIKNVLFVTATLLLISTSYVQATSKSVSSATVTEGQKKLKMKGSVDFDDDDDTEWSNKVEFEYGLTGRLQLGIEGETEKVENGSLEYKATEVKAKFELTDGSYFLKSAVQTKYEMNHLGGAGSVGIKFNVQKSYGQWDHRVNFDFTHEVGGDKRSGVDTAIKLGTYHTFDGYKLGAEYYADFGRLSDRNDFEDQEHHIGPVVGFNIPVGSVNIGAKLGYLAGLTDGSADHVAKYEFEYKF